MRPFEIWIFLPTPDPPIHLTFMSATPPRLSLSAIRSLLAPTSLEMVKLSKMNKSQKVLLAYAALYAVYSLFWLGEMVGLQDAGLKFFGKRAGKIQVSAATWGGVGGLTLALDPAALTRARLATRMPGRRHGDDPVGAPRGARRRGRHDRGGACRPGPTRWRSLPRALPCTAATAATAGCVRTCRSFAPASVTRSHAQAPASADYPPPPGRQISAEELVDETKNDDVQQARAAGRM